MADEMPSGRLLKLRGPHTPPDTPAAPDPLAPLELMVQHVWRTWEAEVENSSRLAERQRLMLAANVALVGLGLFKADWVENLNARDAVGSILLILYVATLLALVWTLRCTIVASTERPTAASPFGDTFARVVAASITTLAAVFFLIHLYDVGSPQPIFLMIVGLLMLDFAALWYDLLNAQQPQANITASTYLQLPEKMLDLEVDAHEVARLQLRLAFNATRDLARQNLLFDRALNIAQSWFVISISLVTIFLAIYSSMSLFGF